MNQGPDSNFAEQLPMEEEVNINMADDTSNNIFDLLKALPLEIAVHIMSFLPVPDLVRAELVNQNWKTISDSDRQNLLRKENLKNDLEAKYKKIRHSHPAELIETFGGVQNLAKLPLFDYRSEESREVARQKMQGARIKRSKQPLIRSPFEPISIISFCAKNNAVPNQKPMVQDLESCKEEKKQFSKMHLHAGESSIFPAISCMKDPDYEYLRRLISGEPCGLIVNQIEGPRTLESGRSVIELTDQSEFQGILDKEEITLVSERPKTAPKKTTFVRYRR